MKSQVYKDKTKYLVLAQALLFVLFLVITSYFNQFAIDDYFFIGELRTKSFIEIYKHLYFEWHGRWTSNFLMVGFIQLHNIPFFLFFYNLLSIGLLYLGITRLLKTINTYYQLQIKSNQTFIFSAIGLSILFFCTISPNDSWLWYTSSIVYLWSTMFLFVGISICFKHQKKLLDYFLFGISAIYIGGSNEPLALFSIALLLYLIFRKKEITVSIIGLILIGTSFLINYLSSGTISRDEITPSLDLTNIILYTGYGSIKFLIFSIHKTFIPALFLAIPFYFLGKDIPAISYKFKLKKELLKSFIFISVVTVINQLVVIYALGGLAPERSTMTSSIVIAIIIIRLLFLLGNQTNEISKKLNFILLINVVALIGFNIYFANTHSNYTKSVDNRLSDILNSENLVIKVKPLSQSGYLYSSEITTDPNHFKNQHLKSGLGVNKDIVLED